MSARPSRCRRLAARLAGPAAHILPGAGASWAEAMRSEMDYIDKDSAALRWALGCLLAGYRERWRARAPALTWRAVATSAIVLLVIGLALQANAGDRSEPMRPACPAITAPADARPA